MAAGVALWTTGPVPRGPTWPRDLLRGYLLAWVCYVVAAVIATRSRSLPKWVLVWIVVAAIGLRAVALVRVPRPSTDIRRYLWDGRVINAGINPYGYPPNAPQLRHLRDDNWPSISFRHVRTIYPPAAQLLFAALARMKDSDPQLFRWAFALFDVASVLILIALLRRTGQELTRVIWYAWCPLPVTETTAGGHVDAFGLCLLLLALLLAARRGGKPGPGAAIALAGAVMTKGFAVLAVPFFVRRGGWRFLGWFAGTCGVLLLPFISAGRRLFDGLTAYLSAWKANASVFVLTDWLLEHVTVSHYQITRLASLTAILAVLVYLVWRQHPGIRGIIGGSFAAIAAQLLLGAPTLPWYVIWSLPALCWWAIPGWVLFSLTVSLHYYAGWGYGHLGYLVLWAGYLPVYALLIGHLIWWRAARSRSASSRTP